MKELFLLQPYLRDKWKICDSCGVNNLHGMPSLLGITSQKNSLSFNDQLRLLKGL
jgi:hypothetical protein